MDHVTNTEGVSIVQINNWLLTILGILMTVILALFVYMNSRFSEAGSERSKLGETLSKHTESLARLETLVKLSITLKGYTIDQVEKKLNEELKKQENRLT
ncbi:MAG: hypothetical protein HC932_01055 [Thermales bacterium]|nr:hypothetical protein [Thermales bacterium]